MSNNASASVKKENNPPSKHQHFFLHESKECNNLFKLCVFAKIIAILNKKKKGKEPPKLTTVVATKGKGDDETEEISYTDAKVIGNGSFGVVYQARLIGSNELVAIKKVLQDRRYKVSAICDSAYFNLIF